MYPGQPQYPGSAPQGLTIVAPLKLGNGPAARNLMGRTVAVIVQSYNPNNRYPGDDKPNPQAIADLYVLDGGPLTYGEGERPPTPATHRSDAPTFFSGVYLNGPIAQSVGPYAGTGSVAMCRYVQGKTARLLVDLGSELDPRAAEAPALREQLTRLILAHRQHQWTPPTPVELNGGQGSVGAPSTPQAAQNYTPQVQYGPGAVAGGFAPAVPAVPQVPQLPPAAPARSWHPGLAAAGWTEAVWASEAGKLSDADYQAWMRSVGA